MKKRFFVCMLLVSMLACFFSGCKGGSGVHEHNFGAWKITQAPTCVQKGTKERTCSVCGNVEYHDADPLPHAFNEGNVCKDCGKELAFSKGLSYELSEDGNAYLLTGLGICTDTEIVVPYYYQGKPVTEIKAESFIHASFTSFEIQGSIQKIGKNAFNGCANLTSFYMYDTVEEVGNFAFTLCTSLNFVRLSDKLTILDELFYSCSALEEVEIGDHVEEIGAFTFFECASLREISLPSSLKTIGTQAFAGCSSLVSVEIPSKVKVIERGLFIGCSKLKRVTFYGKLDSIGMDEFAGCSELREVVYNGTKEDFENVKKGIFWEGNDDTRKFTVVCTDGSLSWNEFSTKEE